MCHPRSTFSLSFLRKCKFSSSFVTYASRPYSVASVDFISTLSPTQESRFNEFTNTLSTSLEPSYIWASYTNLITLLGAKPLPLEFHQRVLRHCSPPWRELRDILIQTIKAGQFTYAPPIPYLETRFRALISNIRLTGAKPSVDDFNFILSQFASYGHFEACAKLYSEMKRIGVIPDHATIAYCLRAMAYRLTLPSLRAQRADALEHVLSLFPMYSEDMKTYNIPMTDRVLDLSLRIMKETTNLDALEGILRTAYAVDLSNMDCVPLEFSNTENPPARFTFTTSTLNTTLETLGMVGSVSKLVQAFEVLTQPLPRANQHLFNSFESDEEGDFGVAVDVPPPFTPPSALPNTASYGILLRHLCQAGHHILARHYIVEALQLHKSTAFSLRNAVRSQFVRNKPIYTIPRPNFQISRLMLLSVLGDANTEKNVALLTWLDDKLPRIIKTFKSDITQYSVIIRKIRTSVKRRKTGDLSFMERVKREHYSFDAEIEETHNHIPTKHFDIQLHLDILKRNLQELESFHETLKLTRARIIQRVKENLGRRVWAGKDVFMQTEASRVGVTKDAWKKTVNFKPAPSQPSTLNPKLMPPSLKPKLVSPIQAGSNDLTRPRQMSTLVSIFGAQPMVLPLSPAF